MSQRNGYDPGVPCWVDLSSTDVAASARFYGDLFGWRADMIDDPEAGGYGMFLHEGKKVAGLGSSQGGGPVSVWNTFVATGDAAAVADRVKNSGGTVVMEPMAVFDEGTMTVFQAPDGSYASAWQAAGHHGAELVDEPGAFCWNELYTRDAQAAERFYSAVFGWTPRTSDMGGMPYTEWLNDGASVAGMMTMPQEAPREVPSYWLTYFAVADLDAALRTASESGANVLVGVTESPPGRFAQLVDPQGATFGVIQLNEIA
ncbi:MAG: VOC family protein [Nonomuraea sp.]|nr:VOC family protein [Nonomuraea sp.]NUP60585.1 VOC family protein [Nonomuraea sp.]NUP77481.1 VOC family protein [Nonomuraea sp.]NUS03354.1 VOC family protein [Nonomuraea sp.]NUT10261.1 VOC family protein [Nonomuraea sp.]